MSTQVTAVPTMCAKRSSTRATPRPAESGATRAGRERSRATTAITAAGTGFFPRKNTRRANARPIAPPRRPRRRISEVSRARRDSSSSPRRQSHTTAEGRFFVCDMRPGILNEKLPTPKPGMPGRHFLLRGHRFRLTIISISGGTRLDDHRATALSMAAPGRRSRSMRRTSALIGFCALLAGAVPAVAGEVYVPFASNRSVGGATYQTKVWVTNPSTAARQFSVRFINQNTDGTQGAGGGDKLNVPGGGTLLLDR